ncbi:BA75_03290T0 [Komagataella pastoris]|uniref:BA75_03290T0 n=1 Tax=Komagataella pastoris TaxID=4922 RepID=A0A1B2JCR8_PICPA|nr:BA75_03290T0 [Komagataella pastoris]
MSLFVPEDDETQPENMDLDVSKGNLDGDSSKADTNSDEEDPVVNEVPIHINSRLTEELVILQYTNRFKQREQPNISQVRFKPQAGVLELNVPLEKSKYFSPEKSAEWDNIDKQILRGVLNDSSAYYAGVVKNGAIHLNPIQKNGQVRPYFEYMDQRKSEKQNQFHQQLKIANETTDASKKEVRVVQMSMKTTVDSQPRLGGALQSNKNESEEAWVDYAWLGSSKEQLHLANKDDTLLQSNMTRDEYMGELFKETRVDL